jgi:hypothetical protein
MTIRVYQVMKNLILLLQSFLYPNYTGHFLDLREIILEEIILEEIILEEIIL